MMVTITRITSSKQPDKVVNVFAARLLALHSAYISYRQVQRGTALLSMAPDLILKDLGIVRRDIKHVVRLGRR